MRKRLLFLAVFLLAINVVSLHAQLGFEQLIKTGPSDVTKLVNAYSRPLLKGFGMGMNSGWTNSAQTLKLFRFDIRVTATGVVVPQSERSFDVTQIGLSSNIRPADPSKVISPSFSGNKDSNGPLMDVFDSNNNKLISFELPKGVIESVVPTPQVQLTMGFFANTDVSIRAVPRVRISKNFGSVSLIGFGIKHNFVRDFVPANANAPFDLALAFGYNRLTYKKALNVQPFEGSVPQNPDQPNDFSGQEVYGVFNNYLFQAILSKQLSFFTPFVSVGYNISRTDLGVKGNYPVIDSISADRVAYKNYTDPVSIQQTFLKEFRVDAGFQIKLPIIRLFASYGYSQGYSIVNGGIGLGI